MLLAMNDGFVPFLHRILSNIGGCNIFYHNLVKSKLLVFS